MRRRVRGRGKQDRRVRDATDQQRLRDNLQAEIDGASLYRALAGIEAGTELATVYTHMAETEERHADIWRPSSGRPG